MDLISFPGREWNEDYLFYGEYGMDNHERICNLHRGRVLLRLYNGNRADE